MFIDKLHQWLQPLLDGEDFSSGGGQADPGTVTDSSTPEALEVSDDSLIRVAGSDKPVKFGEHVKGFQAQFTKASQRAARLEQELQTERQARQQLEQSQRQATQVTGSADPYEQLRQLPYLDGQQAAAVVESIAGQIRQRDMILLGALQQMQQMQQIVQQLNSSAVSANWEGQIDRWLQDGGYPAEAKDLAKEIYLAYEGDNLNEEFPEIFKARWNQIEKLIDARRQASLRQARPTFVPGRGGNTGPSQPLKLKPSASAQEIADQLWPALEGATGV